MSVTIEEVNAALKVINNKVSGPSIIGPAKGFTHNPLHAPELRNKPCICGSGRKVKKCHGQHIYIEIELREALDKIETTLNEIMAKKEEVMDQTHTEDSQIKE